MNCKRAERYIYLYAELTERQRKAVDKHLQGCSSCRSLYEKVRQEHSLVINTLSAPFVPNNQAALTGKIMSGLAAHEPTSQWSTPRIRETVLRWTMAAVSIFFVGLFLQEYNQVDRYTLQQAATTRLPATGPKLNSRLLPEGLRKLMEKDRGSEKLSIADCLTQCDESSAKDCADCRAYYQKFIR